MEVPLILAGLAMGVAASPHCAAMCGAPCAALCRDGRQATGFQAGRLLGYMAGGAVAAASFVWLGQWMQDSPVLRPLWTMLHLAFLALGLWWLATGRHPTWMDRPAKVSVVQVVPRGATPSPLSRWAPAARSGAAGLAWVAWPCGALQAALLLAAMASSAAGGALVMGAYALASMPALVAVPWVWRRWSARRNGDGAGSGASKGPSAALFATWGLRLGGLALVASSGWALGHGLWLRVAAWCVSL